LTSGAGGQTRIADPGFEALIGAGAVFSRRGPRLRGAVQTCYTSARKILHVFKS
jgi:hypothetical protein